MQNKVDVRSPWEKHEESSLVYPVYSRRSGGLSLGINLFPYEKVCSFDCPYCEVFPSPLPEKKQEKTSLLGSSRYVHSGFAFSPNEQEIFLMALEQQLRDHITLFCGMRSEKKAPYADTSIRDICFSGNGEPTLSPLFLPALHMVHRVRTELIPSAAIVLITNGTGLVQPELFDALVEASCGEFCLDIWLKIDAVTDEWFRLMSGSTINRETLHNAFLRFSAQAPFTVQTMLCKVNGRLPPESEVVAWESFILELCRIGQNGPGKESFARGIDSLSLQDKGPFRGPQRIHLYGKARPSPHDPRAEMAPPSYLSERATSLRQVLQQNKYSHVRVEVFL
ncbi:MAG: hypothetical protein N2Z76_06495 [Treponemataceae bacterium]|nr:hypothetical protein [Treponemataceae bacterium]